MIIIGMPYLEPKLRIYCHSSFREPEQYGAWGDSNSVSFEGRFVLHTKKKYGVDEIDFDVAEGDVLFMILAVWSSGDSFGTSEDGSHECIQIYKSQDKAEKAAAILREAPLGTFNCADWTVEIETESGQTLKYFRPWLGYFESLSRLEVCSGIVE